MASTQVVLTDVDRGLWQDSLRLDANAGIKLAGAANWSIQKTTLRGGLSDGVEVVTLDNGALSMSVFPTRGMGLWRGQFRGIPIEWKSPVVRPVHPQFVNQLERGGLGWLNGFNELMCRCGLSFNGPPGDDNGSQLTLHGRVANLPAHYVAVEVCDDGQGTICVTGTVDETTMFGPALRLSSTVSTQAGSNSITISDRITNLGAQPTELELLYHTNIGRPFMEEGSRFVAAIAEVAPRDAHSALGATKLDRYSGPITGVREEAFFFELQGDAKNQTTVLLKNATSDLGLSLSYSLQELPCFTLWKNPQADADGYVTGLEPGTDFPNFRSFERSKGRVISLAPGASHAASFTLSIHDSAQSVKTVEDLIGSLQTREPIHHLQPIVKYSQV